jgi:hypothetical protein
MTDDEDRRDELLQQVLAQPETKEIADALGLELQDYAELVVHYKLHPDDEPEILTMDEGAAKQAGVPTIAETKAFLEGVASGAIDVTPEEEQTRFAVDDDEKDAVTLTGAKRIVRAPTSAEAPSRTAAPKPSRGLKR